MDARYARKARATLVLCTGPAAVPPIGHWRCVCLLRLSSLNSEARPYNDFQGVELTAEKKSETKVLNPRFIPSFPRDV